MHSFVNEFLSFGMFYFLRFFFYKYIGYWSLYGSNLVLGWLWEHKIWSIARTMVGIFSSFLHKSEL